MVIVADGDSHGSLLGAIAAEGGAGLKADLLKFAIPKIPVQILRSRIVCNVDVGLAGPAKISPDRAEAIIALRIIHAGCARHVGKGSVAVVVEEGIASPLQSSRTALNVDTAVFAIWRASKLGQVVQVKIDIVRHDQVNIPVVVVVAERCARGPATVSDTSFCSHIGESAIAVIAIEDVTAEASDV